MSAKVVEWSEAAVKLAAACGPIGQGKHGEANARLDLDMLARVQFADAETQAAFRTAVEAAADFHYSERHTRDYKCAICDVLTEALRSGVLVLRGSR